MARRRAAAARAQAAGRWGQGQALTLATGARTCRRTCAGARVRPQQARSAVWPLPVRLFLECGGTESVESASFFYKTVR